MNEKLITAMSEAQIDMKKRQENMANPKIMPPRLILSQEERIKICSDNNKAAKRALFLSAEQWSRGRV